MAFKRSSVRFRPAPPAKNQGVRETLSSPFPIRKPLLAPKTLMIRSTIMAVLTIMALMGCSTVDSRKPPAPLPPGGDAHPLSPSGWWYARFAMEWPQGQEPSWHLDLLLAHRVVAPVLDRYRGEIALWRFHRRAIRDSAGHQFSFIFHASPETARKVFSTIQVESTLKEMKARGLILRDSYDDPSVITRPNIQDTSDPRWPPAIQKSWPYYILGVSEMWLNLIADMADGSPEGKTPGDLKEMLAIYEQANASIETLWQEQGQHAFLHHLNAIFGYEPLAIHERRLMTF
jgi:hypothetical protein